MGTLTRFWQRLAGCCVAGRMEGGRLAKKVEQITSMTEAEINEPKQKRKNGDICHLMEIFQKWQQAESGGLCR